MEIRNTIVKVVKSIFKHNSPYAFSENRVIDCVEPAIDNGFINVANWT
ncbi:MAG: hypothetical protein V4622_13910 [Bacteroidota bacterium]